MRKLTAILLAVVITGALTAQNFNPPVGLPFIENFETQTGFENNWINTSTTGNPWQYVGWDVGPDGEEGYLQVTAPFSGVAADAYLITSNPIIIPASGSYHISFYANTGTSPWETLESIRILYGLTSNPAEMTVLADYPGLSSADWSQVVKNFDITTPGNYYFGFHYYSDRADGAFFLNFDKVEIDAEQMGGVPDIAFVTGLAPVSGCGLSSESVIGAEVVNLGTGVISEFTLTYQIGNATPVSQTFTETMSGQEHVTVYFNQKANLSAVGIYQIKFTASTPDEVNTDNNETELTVTHFAPITELPFESNFSIEADRANWFPETEGGWLLVPESNPNRYYAIKNNVPLLSRCVTLEPGEHRFTYNYKAGYLKVLVWHTDDFYVTYGKSGTDPATWTPVKEYLNCFTEEITKEELLITINEAGEYVFAFFPVKLNVEGDKLSVFSTSIEKVLEHDLRITNIASPASFPRITPAYHTSGEKTFTVTVENRGKFASENGTVELWYNNNLLGSENFTFTELGEIKDVGLTSTFEQLTTGEKQLLFKAKLESGGSREMKITKVVSDSTFAWDRLDDGIFFGSGLGSNEPCKLGLIYELQKTDILTSMTIRLMELENPNDMGLAVYKVNDNLEIGEMLFYVEHPRPLGNNLQGITFEVPKTELTPGKYFFEIRQLNDANISVAYDLDPAGYLYLLANATGELEVISGFGYICLRPNFNKPLGISPVQIPENQLILYPNPSKGMVSVTLGEQTMEKVVIYNASGQIVHVFNINDTSFQFNTQNFSPGLYFISVQTKTDVVNSKFVVN
ncbi:MAG: T9SS type A sorting domain-containing protein [Bacteroidales bacterium]|jgi:hypothetical protein|nr:T9SS type A sorting domain-containing protein [Bacteroidales bacterium]